MPPEQSNHEDKDKSERKSKTGFNKRLLKNKYREEQCFEEARAYAGSYKLLVGSSSNFNLLQVNSKADQSSQMDVEDDEDGSLDISMAESFSRSVAHSTSSKQPLKLQRVGSKTEGKRLFQPDASFEVGLNQTAISTASSTINEFDAVGVPKKKDEETINTKLAMRELSMMFSSPAFGVDGGRRQNDFSIARSRINESTDEDDEDQSFGILGDGVMLDNSICNTGSEENDGGRNPSTRTNTTQGFEKMALRELKTESAEEESEPRLGCRSQVGRAVGDIMQSDPLTRHERDLEPNPGFAIFEDDGASSDAMEVNQPASAMGFQIFEDEGDDVDDSDKKPAAKSSRKNTAFGETSRFSPDKSSEVYESRLEHGDTASISDAIALLGGNGDKDESGNISESVEETDTATLNLFNEVFCDEQPPTQNEAPKAGGFSIYAEDQDENNDQVS